jgi:hypothetical protein
MGIFGREGEVIDYTLLEKKGLLRAPKKKKPEIEFKTEEGFVDFTSIPHQTGTIEPSVSVTAAPEPVPDLGFLNEMAGVGASSSSSLTNETPNLSSNDGEIKARLLELNAMKIKIEDLDYKVEKFIEKMDRIEELLQQLDKG